MSSLRALLLVAALVAAGVSANLKLSVMGDERRVIDLGTFGFAKGGHFELTVEHIFVDDPSNDLITADGRFHHNESLGFMLMIVDSAQDARYIRTSAQTDGKASRQCLDSDELATRDSNGAILPRYFFRLQNVTVAEVKKKYEPVEIEREGLYALFFYNCKGYSSPPGTALKVYPISFDADAIEFNLGATGSGANYLSLGYQPLPTVYVCFTLLFGALTFVWFRQMRQNPTHVHHIHRAMLFLVVVKTLSLFFEALKYSHYAATGEPSVWDFFYYVFLTVKGMTLFAVVILLGSGWSFMKAMLSERDKKLLAIILPTQVVVNICIAVVEEMNEGTRGWGTWMDVLRIIDVLCCCIVLLPIVWSIKNLREASEGTDEKSARTLSRMKQFRTFYIVVVAYIYSTRIILAMIEGALGFKYLWISNILAEVISVSFYAYSGYEFRPTQENPYLRLTRDDLEEMESRAEVTQAV